MSKLLKESKTNRIILIIQFIGTVFILIYMPTNIGKTIVLLMFWFITFYPLNSKEIIFFGIISIIFAFLDILAIQNQKFYFSRPDFFGIPIYEIFMWGFYLLHVKKMIRNTVSLKISKKILLLLILFILSFNLISNQYLLFLMLSFIVLLTLVFFHHPLDFIYLFYMIFLGAVIEYIGVSVAGEWSYFTRAITYKGIALWFIPLWGFIGLLSHNLLIPLFYKFHYKTFYKI